MPASKEKRNGEYTGRWIARFSYTDITGDKHTIFKRGFETKREAQEYERDFLYNNSLTVNIPFKNMYIQYLEFKKLRVKETTFKVNFKNSYKDYIFLGDFFILDITPLLISTWQNELLKRDLKGTTVRIINKRLKDFFNWCVKYKGLKTSPMNVTDNIGVARIKKEFNIISIEELNQLLKTFKNPIEKLLIKFLFWTGCRIGEALALTIDDINFNNETININKTLTRLNRANIITTPKTECSNRIISIPTQLAENLKELIKITEYTRENNRLFYITKNQIWKKFKTKTRVLFGREITLHDLRHSHASLLINNNANILAVSKRLGHSNPTMTLNIYSHLYRSTEQTTIDLINKLEE